MEKEERTPILELPYSAGLMSQSCWFVEFKRIVQLIASGKSEDEIKTECLENNLLGAVKEYRAKRVYGYLIARSKMLDAEGVKLQRKAEQPCCEVDHIAGGVAAEAVKPFIDFHGRLTVIVEGTAGHAAAIHGNAVSFRCLTGRDLRLDLGK